MTHTIVRIIELILASGMAVAVTVVFAIALISIVHTWHAAGRPH